jgi:hypothetical protein
VTIKAAASAIIDDLVDSGSFLRTQVSACDYGVLDTSGGCAVVVRPGNSTMEQIGYGGGELNTWGFIVQGYVRDTGNVTEFLGRVYDMHDALREAINTGTNANTAMLTTKVVSTLHSPDTSFVSPGGNDFSLVTANVTAREDP